MPKTLKYCQRANFAKSGYAGYGYIHFELIKYHKSSVNNPAIVHGAFNGKCTKIFSNIGPMAGWWGGGGGKSLARIVLQ